MPRATAVIQIHTRNGGERLGRRSDGPHDLTTGGLIPLCGFVAGHGGFGGFRGPVHPFEEQAHHRGKIPGRHLISTHQGLNRGELGSAFWLPGPENPADGLTKENGYLDPPLSFLKAGSFFPGTLRPLRWVATREFPEGQVPRPCVSVAILFFPRARVNFFAHFS